MDNLKNIQGVISWRTSKNADGTFTGRVISIEYGKPCATHYEYTAKTRARALTQTKKAVRYAKAFAALTDEQTGGNPFEGIA